MENNEYSGFKENIPEKLLMSESELFFPRENETQQELIFDSDETNLGVTVFSAGENENVDETRRQQQESQSQDAPSNVSSGANSSTGVSSSAGSAAGTTAAGATAGAAGGAACAAVAGVTLMVLIVSMIVNISVSFLKFDIYATFVDYLINVKLELKLEKDTQLDFENFDTGLFLVVKSNNQTFTTPLNAANKKLEPTFKITSQTDELVKIEYDFRGQVEGLKEGENYQLEVFSEDGGNKKVYYTKTFKTKSNISKINSIEIENKRLVDGNLYFWIDLIDENNYFSNFTYMLLRPGSEAPYMRGKIEGDPSVKTAINISDLKDKTCTLIISYNSTDPKDAADPNQHKETEITL